MDVVFDAGGRLNQIEGKEKLQFLLLKCVLTGRYVEETTVYGSTVTRLLGGKARQANELTDGMYLMSVDRAIESYRTGQSLGLESAERMIRSEGEIQVARDPKDRTILLVGASVVNGDGQSIPILHQFKTS